MNQDFSIIHLLLNASWVVQAVVLLLMTVTVVAEPTKAYIGITKVTDVAVFDTITASVKPSFSLSTRTAVTSPRFAPYIVTCWPR